MASSKRKAAAHISMAEASVDQVPAAATIAGPPFVSLARGRVAHSTRGRVRLQFPKMDRTKLQAISTRLREMDHVNDVEIREASGSVVIQHAPNAPDFVPYLKDFVAETGLFLFEVPEDPEAGVQHFTAVERDAHYLIEHSRLGEQILRYTEHLNRAVKQLTEGWIDLRVLLPASVGVLALIVVNVESSPMWLPLALFSYQSFSNLHQPSAASATAQRALPSPTPVTLEAL